MHLQRTTVLPLQMHLTVDACQQAAAIGAEDAAAALAGPGTLHPRTTRHT